MAYSFARSKFLFSLDLKYGVWTYGAIMALMTLYYIFYPNLNINDWIALIFITTPAATLAVLLFIDQTNFAYAWANWYFSFVAFIFGTIFIVMQTLMLQRMKKSVGNGSIQFRISEAGNPLSPHLIGEPAFGEDQFVQQSLDAMPKRYYDIQSLVHGGFEDFKWENGDATKSTSVNVLNLFIWLDVTLYFFFCYFTVINYSYFNAAKSWSSYSNYNLAT